MLKSRMRYRKASKDLEQNKKKHPVFEIQISSDVPLGSSIDSNVGRLWASPEIDESWSPAPLVKSEWNC